MIFQELWEDFLPSSTFLLAMDSFNFSWFSEAALFIAFYFGMDDLMLI